MGINKTNVPGSFEKQVIATDKTTKAVRRGLGDYGAKFINDDAVHVGKWYAVQALNQVTIDVSDCEFNGVAGNSTSGDQVDVSAGDIKIPDGCTVFLNANKLSIASGGTAIFYRRP